MATALALRKNNDIIHIYVGEVPVLVDGTRTLIAGPGAHAGWSTVTPDGNAYELLEARFTDTPQTNQVQLAFDGATLAQWTVTDGVASGPRKWSTTEITRDAYNGMINRERDRRITLGLSVEVSPGKSIPADTRNSEDLRNIQGLATIAFARIMESDTSPIPFRGSDNVTYLLTPQEMWKLANGEGVAGRVAFLYAKAWALKDAAEMAADYAADSHWA